jgi:hypothetical protein
MRGDSGAAEWRGEGGGGAGASVCHVNRSFVWSRVAVVEVCKVA